MTSLYEMEDLYKKAASNSGETSSCTKAESNINVIYEVIFSPYCRAEPVKRVSPL